MSPSRAAALYQCEKENDAGRPYKPSPAWVCAAQWFAEEGLFSKGAVGGYYLTPEGIRRIARLRREKVV